MMECRNQLGQFVKGHKFWLGKKRPNISRENHYNWKGGVIIQEGYRYILCPNHPKAHHKGGYVAEHVLIMELMIGRFLKTGEIVHHRDEDRLNNKPENLRLCKNLTEHNKIHRGQHL